MEDPSKTPEISEVSDDELLSQSDPEDTITLAEGNGSDDDDDDDDDEEGEEEPAEEEQDEDDNEPTDVDPNPTFNIKNEGLLTSSTPAPLIEDDSSDEESDDDYLKKLDGNIDNNYIDVYHPDQKAHNYDEILSMTNVVRNQNGIIIDPLHRSIPFLTKYERTRIIGYRAQQLNKGARAYIDITNDIVDGYQIAIKELEQKKIPFILRRPLPGGGSEYWRLSDLELIA